MFLHLYYYVCFYQHRPSIYLQHEVRQKREGFRTCEELYTHGRPFSCTHLYKKVQEMKITENNVKKHV